MGTERLLAALFLVLSPTPAEYSWVADLLSQDGGVRADASKKLIASKDRSLLAALSDVLSFYRVTREEMRAREVSWILRQLSGEDERGDWIAWIGRHSEIKPKEGYLHFKAAVFALYDPSFRDFLDPGKTFRIRPEEIEWGGVKKDGIPALDYPRHIPAAEAGYLRGDDLVFGVDLNGESRAYPFRIMDWHELVNDFVGGVTVSLSYCTLCGSGILFDGRLEGETYSFGSSGLLYRSNKLMYDRQTGSLWSQLTGQPVSGLMAGSDVRLVKLPLVVSAWKDWAALHPETMVLSPETGYERDYDRSPYEDYSRSSELMFPVWLQDDRLSTKDRVLALVVNGRPKAYPIEVLKKAGILHDRLGGKDIVLLSDGKTEAVRVYESRGRRFSRGTSPAALVEEETGGVWDVTEDSLTSDASGEKLLRLPAHTAFWFGWYAFFPSTELYDSPQSDR